MFEDAYSVATREVLPVFDDLLQRRQPAADRESVAVLDRVRGFAMVENRAAAAQLMAIGQVFADALERNAEETVLWAVDTEAAVAAEVAAGLRITQAAAAARVRHARVLRERLPETGEAFFAGHLCYAMFLTIVAHTDRISDPDVLKQVDWQIAVRASRWPALSRGALAAEVDRIVAGVDADAVWRRRERRQDRQVWFGDNDEGLTEIAGSLHTTDAKALDARLSAVAATVCGHDSRTRAQRRADALGALAAGADRLACDCGREDCAAGARPASRPVVIHVIAEAATLNGTGVVPASVIGVDGLITAELLAELAKTATLVALRHPGGIGPEPGYRPSQGLADFVRARDLTCRWPGCEVPATNCDLDHTIPYARGGPTHASNLKCYCRIHHLTKTFWGWRDTQLPDATLILSSPTGQTYVTTPGSAWLFPGLCAPTADLPPTTTPPAPNRPAACADRGAMMPQRRRTRDQDRATRITVERNHNQQQRQAAQAAQAAAREAAAPDPDDPPPF